MTVMEQEEMRVENTALPGPNWTKIYLIVTLLAFAVAAQHYFGQRYHPVFLPEHTSLPYIVYSAMVEAYLWLALFFVIFRIARALPFPDSGKRLLLHFPAAILLASLHAEIHNLLNWLPLLAREPFLPAPWMYRFGYFLKIASGMIVYFILAAIAYGIIFYRGSVIRTLQAKRLLYQLEEGELRHFKMNLLPSVLLGILGTIHDWIDRDRDAAEDLIAGLGDYLRHHLSTLRNKNVSVREELDMIRSFHRIVAPCMNQSIVLECSASPDASGARIPGFLLQSPIEWIIEHLYPDAACTIRIRADRLEDRLHLPVHFSGNGIPKLPETVIHAMQKRLRSAYGTAFEFRNTFMNPESCVFEITAPFEQLIRNHETAALSLPQSHATEGSHSEEPEPEEVRTSSLLAWGVLAWAGILVLYFAGRFTDMAVTQRSQEIFSIHRIHEMSHWLAWILFTPWIFLMYRWFPLAKPRLWRSIAAHAVMNILLWYTAIFLELSVEGRLNSCWNFPFLSIQGLKEAYSAHIYWAILGMASFARDYRKRRTEEVRNWQLRTMVANAQVRELKMQLQPHFLFNMLNSLIEMIHMAPDSARKMVRSLIAFLRDTMEHADVREVSFHKELDLLNQYLQLQKIRFQDRLHVEMDIDPQSLSNRVPHFLLQPIVENALRYGVAASEDIGRIRISSHCDGGKLELQVRDNGPGVKGLVVEGIGLSNTRKRLEHFYGENYDFVLANAPTGGLIVTLQIPDRKSFAEAP